MATEVRVGDRIRLTGMRDDPAPMMVGSTGTVVGVGRHGGGAGAWLQIDVRWDCGRALMLVSPPDEFEILPRETTRLEETP